MPMIDRAASRRRFIQYLAASPLFAGTSLAALAAPRIGRAEGLRPSLLRQCDRRQYPLR